MIRGQGPEVSEPWISAFDILAYTETCLTCLGHCLLQSLVPKNLFGSWIKLEGLIGLPDIDPSDRLFEFDWNQRKLDPNA